MASGSVKVNPEKGRVLVVEDDPAVQEMILMLLRADGYVAVAAGDGLQALARLQHDRFDVVVTDFRMPRLDGLALLREIRRMEVPLPVIILTGNSDTFTEASFRHAGAFRVLRKGGNLGDIVRWVEKASTASKNLRVGV